MADTSYHAEFSSADASALSEPNSRFTLYQLSTKTAITVQATDTVVVTDVLLRVGAAALTVNVYDGADNVVDPGEKIFSGSFPANSGDAVLYSTPHFCQVGTYPKVKTSIAGQVDMVIRGYVRTTA